MKPDTLKPRGSSGAGFGVVPRTHPTGGRAEPPGVAGIRRKLPTAGGAAPVHVVVVCGERSASERSSGVPRPKRSGAAALSLSCPDQPAKGKRRALDVLRLQDLRACVRISSPRIVIGQPSHLPRPTSDGSPRLRRSPPDTRVRSALDSATRGNRGLSWQARPANSLHSDRSRAPFRRGPHVARLGVCVRLRRPRASNRRPLPGP